MARVILGETKRDGEVRHIIGLTGRGEYAREKDVVALTGSNVIAEWDSEVTALSGSEVEALRGSFVKAQLGSVITALDGSVVHAYEGSVVRARKGSNVTAFAGAVVYCEAGSNVLQHSGSALFSAKPVPDVHRPSRAYTDEDSWLVAMGGVETLILKDGRVITDAVECTDGSWIVYHPRATYSPDEVVHHLPFRIAVSEDGDDCGSIYAERY